jgi:membrane associated rhomboid family serine protease
MSDNGSHRDADDDMTDKVSVLPVRESDLRQPKKHEPILNRLPVGAAGLVAAILTAHLISVLAGADAARAAYGRFGVVPTLVFENVAQHRFGETLMPLIAYQFIHSGSLHLVMNLAMFLQVGPIAEIGLGRNRDGVARFIIFYLACGIFAALFYCWLNPNSAGPTIGSSGAISGVFAGFLWAAIGLAKPGKAILKPVLTSAAVFLLINVGLAWVGRATNVAPIAWETHLGGFLAGLVLYPMFARFGRNPTA